MTRTGRRFLVTGAAGFVGANLCSRLAQTGEDVHALVKPSTSMWRLQEIADRVEVHLVDITDPAAVDALVDAVRPTVIYHLATHGAYHYQNITEQILLVNVTGLWNLVRACSRVGFELLVNTGSSSEYGLKSFAMRETDVLEPDSFYAVAKAAQSLLCRYLGRSTHRAIVTLRLFSVYGPYEEQTRLVPRLMAAAIDAKPVDMTSPDFVRDFVYIDDVIDVYLQVDRLKEMAGEILNVGTGVQTSLGELMKVMGELNGAPIDARWGRLPPRTWDTNAWVADVSKLRLLVGAVPQTTVTQGLAATLEWFRRHRGAYAI
jgi:nucleoside-diphosphate-sugar epimerase